MIGEKIVEKCVQYLEIVIRGEGEAELTLTFGEGVPIEYYFSLQQCVNT